MALVGLVPAVPAGTLMLDMIDINIGEMWKKMGQIDASKIDVWNSAHSEVQDTSGEPVIKRR